MELPQFVIPGLEHINLSWIINRPVLLIILGLFFVIYAIMTWVLMYHWSAYGMKSHGILVAKTLFLFVSTLLFVVSGLALTYF